MIKRYISKQIEKRLFRGKVIILIGARQVGKTTLINNLLKHIPEKQLVINGDEADSFFWAIEPTAAKLKILIGDHKIVFIDEAQRITNIGIIMKLIIDNISGVQVIATGSSALEMKSLMNEPLTGRKYEFHLFPISFSEMVHHSNLLEETKMLHQRLIYGSYPEVLTHPEDNQKLLNMLAGSYLYKDILALDAIRKPDILENLVRALAFQIGNEVNYQELGQLVKSDAKTVGKYIDLLEKTYVIFRLPAFSKNLRNEIKKGRKIYFYDNGIRNAVIGNFTDIEVRTDKGALWENYLISERRKILNYQDIYTNSYFWRTFQQSEIDYIEEANIEISAFEFKWNPKAKWNISRPFKENYHPKEIKIIHTQNYYEFLGIE